MTLQLNNANGNHVGVDYIAAATTDHDIVFPEADGTVALTADIPGTGDAGGEVGNIGRATLWRVNSLFSANDAVINDWETPDQTGEVGNLGPANQGVTQTNGVFQFPVTGIWLVNFNGMGTVAAGDTQATVNIQFSSDSVNWFNRAQCSAGNGGTGNQIQSFVGQAMLIIDDLANDRVRFTTATFSAGTNITGNSTTNQSSAFFLRLGDAP